MSIMQILIRSIYHVFEKIEGEHKNMWGDLEKNHATFPIFSSLVSTEKPGCRRPKYLCSSSLSTAVRVCIM